LGIKLGKLDSGELAVEKWRGGGGMRSTGNWVSDP